MNWSPKHGNGIPPMKMGREFGKGLTARTQQRKINGRKREVQGLTGFSGPILGGPLKRIGANLGKLEELSERSPVARTILAFPLSSFTSEWLFSTSGHVINEKRSRLKSTNLDTLVRIIETLQQLAALFFTHGYLWPSAPGCLDAPGSTELITTHATAVNGCSSSLWTPPMPVMYMVEDAPVDRNPKLPV
ncbi:uncharacterized protein Dana_GF20185 [Drosophila ananassae]|uniref:HAT C-terminal dimerisation domain-containing protein n=1 Tax=Drosophila ananassae TaxID=7217 RepID=A0A0P8Y556_DROAN|nr:uncharacterized protein Dana_GF20185 [Drosophila ananassae]